MNEKKEWILIINPGSTSTKVAVYENEKCLLSRSVFHDSSMLVQFPVINDQLDYRMEVMNTFLKDSGIDLDQIDMVVGRGGPCVPCASGTYWIDDRLVEDTRACKGRLYHSSMLGVQMAQAFAKMHGCPAIMVDPPVVDELDDVARITGVKNRLRKATAHVLNAKAAGRVYAESIGKKYEDLDLIVAHIDGGISITAHHKGRMIDGNDAGGGEGPFTPTRMGSMAVTDVHDFLWNMEEDAVRDLCAVTGGLSSWFHTSNSADIYYEKVKRNDPEAVLVWNAMLYNTAKWIAMMSAPLKGHVDAIVLTGGLLRIPGVVDSIQERCGWIAPIVSYPGEFESEAMVTHALAVLRHEEEPMTYTGDPVFKGFE